MITAQQLGPITTYRHNTEKMIRAACALAIQKYQLYVDNGNAHLAEQQAADYVISLLRGKEDQHDGQG